MTAARDPRDIAGVFGRIWVDDDRLFVGLPPTEVALRRNLASAAYAYGWQVEEEVVVPGWGRIDIILRDGRSAPLLIELKLDLTRPARIRRAFQQVDGYGRWWAQEYGEAVDTLLVGVEVNADVMASVHRAYPHVGWCPAGVLLSKFGSRGDEEARSLRRRRVISRRADLRNLANAYDLALKDLPPDPVGDVLGILDMFDFAGGAS